MLVISTAANIDDLPQLTLFPRVSKTSKANFGYRFAILREHFFKHRFFEDDELVILTLMKGDEVVKTGEESADGPLLSLRLEPISWSHLSPALKD